MLKILKWKDFNRNRYLQRVRHTAPYGDHFGLLWRPFWIQNGRQNTKILPIWAKYGFQVDFILANWYPSSFLELGAINDPSDHIISCSYYYSSSFFLSSVKSLPDTFLGDALIKLYEILYEYHMPCEVVPLRVDFFKMAAVAMVTTKMPKNTKMIITGY